MSITQLLHLSRRSAPSLKTLVAAGVFAAALLGGCAKPPPPPELPSRPAPQSADLSFEQGIAFAVDDLFIQMQRLPAFAPKAPRAAADAPAASVIVVDTILDAASGQQTVATRLVEERLIERVTEKFPQFDVQRATPEVLTNAEYIVAATLQQVKGDKGAYRVNMSMADVRSGLVVAQAAARVRDDAVDTSPTPFYRDSPSIAKDRVVEGQIRTAETAAGKPADPVYMERLPTNALINEGLVNFNEGNFADALAFYEEAAKRGDGQQLRIYNGLYMSYFNLGRQNEAESAFGKIVAIGLATNNLAVKFLFRPSSTDFWPDSKISGPYPFWLRQVARQATDAKVCLQVVGHTSRTGPDAVNNKLSLQRAESIRTRLTTANRELTGKVSTSGAGFRENIVGSGTDDQRDALDRRVEFKVVNCQ